jgi:hypothetical protein
VDVEGTVCRGELPEVPGVRGHNGLSDSVHGEGKHHHRGGLASIEEFAWFRERIGPRRELLHRAWP